MRLHSLPDTEGKLTRYRLSPNWPLVMLTTVTFEDLGSKRGLTLR